MKKLTDKKVVKFKNIIIEEGGWVCITHLRIRATSFYISDEEIEAFEKLKDFLKKNNWKWGKDYRATTDEYTFSLPLGDCNLYLPFHTATWSGFGMSSSFPPTKKSCEEIKKLLDFIEKTFTS